MPGRGLRRRASLPRHHLPPRTARDETERKEGQRAAESVGGAPAGAPAAPSVRCVRRRPFATRGAAKGPAPQGAAWLGAGRVAAVIAIFCHRCRCCRRRRPHPDPALINGPRRHHPTNTFPPERASTVLPPSPPFETIAAGKAGKRGGGRGGRAEERRGVRQGGVGCLRLNDPAQLAPGTYDTSPRPRRVACLQYPPRKLKRT